MRDSDCVSFLQWALPRLGMRWPGYRKVRGQVCKRIGRRLRQLDLENLQDYQRWLEEDRDEWQILDSLCRITISRFGRDRGVFRVLTTEILPRLVERARANDRGAIRIWSAGCGAGEEPYSVVILSQHRHSSQMPLRILATDAADHQIRRARAAVYPASSLRELEPAIRDRAFERVEPDSFQLAEEHRKAIEFRQQDLRSEMPTGPFDLILCRNLVFTYFDTERQLAILAAFKRRLAGGGYLVLGSHEALPVADDDLLPIPDCPCILGPVPPSVGKPS